MKTCVLLPSYNESKTIAKLVTEVIRKGYDTVVIDDGSHDATGHIAKKAGAFVIHNSQNRGKGVALRQGFQYALEQDYEAVITMDADYQHLPEEIEKFVAASSKKEVGVVVGNRMSKATGMPLVRWFTNRIMSLVISVVCRQSIPDSQCGFRLIKKGVLADMKLKTKKYEIESELLIKASRLGYRIVSIPIQSVYAGQTSQINPVLDSLRFIRFIVRQYFER